MPTIPVPKFAHGTRSQDFARGLLAISDIADQLALGTPAATPKPFWRPFGQAWGPSMPASAMILVIFQWVVAYDQGQWGPPVSFLKAPIGRGA